MTTKRTPRLSHFAMCLPALTCAVMPVNTVSACELPPCSPDYFLPFEGVVPANIAGIQWRPGSNLNAQTTTAASDLMFRCGGTSGAMRDLPFHVDGSGELLMIVPDETLTIGDTCQITVANPQCPDWAGPQPPAFLSSAAAFLVAENAEQPTSLGALLTSAADSQAIDIADYRGCGSATVEACGATIELQRSDAATEWRHALVFETLVDGVVWDVRRRAGFLNPPGGSFVGRGIDLIYAQTMFDSEPGTDPGVALGVHSITMRATLPGTDVMLETAPITVNLDCSDGLDRDAGLVIAPALDGGDVLYNDGGFEDAALTDKPSPPSDCSCSVVGPRATHSFAWLWSLAVIVLLAVRRMRHVKRVVVVGLVLWLAAPIELASACSGPVCLPDQFVPHAGSLPANAAGVLWVPGFGGTADLDAGARGDLDGGVATGETSASDLRFRCTDASGAARVVPFHVEELTPCDRQTFDGCARLIVPDDGFVAGESCVIEPAFLRCDTGWFSADDTPVHLQGSSHFTVTPDAPLPTSLGVMVAESAQSMSITLGHSAGCDGPNDACAVDISVTLSDEAAPWRDTLLFGTWVNGARWAPRSHYWLPRPTGGSWRGRGSDRLFIAAPGPFVENPGLSSPDASAQFFATIPGHRPMLQTSAATVNVVCSVGGGWDAGNHLVNDMDDAEPGCSCRVTGPRVTHSFAWLWSLAVIAVLAARRIRSSRAASRVRARA